MSELGGSWAPALIGQLPTSSPLLPHLEMGTGQLACRDAGGLPRCLSAQHTFWHRQGAQGAPGAMWL